MAKYAKRFSFIVCGLTYGLYSKFVYNPACRNSSVNIGITNEFSCRKLHMYANYNVYTYCMFVL
jgi:hypothetical protein